jgi:hypothetical protein
MNHFIFLGTRIQGNENQMSIHEVCKNEEKPIGKGSKSTKEVWQ